MKLSMEFASAEAIKYSPSELVNDLVYLRNLEGPLELCRTPFLNLTQGSSSTDLPLEEN